MPKDPDPVAPENHIVDDLRAVSRNLSTHAAEFGRNGRVFFPPKEGGEVQPVALTGNVSAKQVAELLYYIADLLE